MTFCSYCHSNDVRLPLAYTRRHSHKCDEAGRFAGLPKSAGERKSLEDEYKTVALTGAIRT